MGWDGVLTAFLVTALNDPRIRKVLLGLLFLHK
jgi:hypothetical protein